MEERYKQFSISLLTVLSLVVGFIYLLAASWLRWGDLFADTNREFWLPLQLLQGKILYREIFYEYGFFPPYFLAGLYRIFGAHINVLVGCGIGLTAGVAILLYKITRLFLDSLIAGLTAFTFLFVFAFGYYYDWSGISHFILPYSFASTFFMFFVCVALYWYLKFLFTAQGRFLWLWSLFMVLALLSRIELSAVIWVGFLAVGGFYLLICRPRSRWSIVFALCSPVLIGSILYGVFLLSMHAWNGFYVSIIQHILTVNKNPFNLRTSGLNDLPLNTSLLFLSLLVHAGIIGLLGIGSACISWFFMRKEQTPFFLFAGAIALLLSAQLSQSQMSLNLQYRGLPMMLGIGIIVCVIQIVRSHDKTKHFAMLTVFVIGLAAMARIVLNATCFGYGFFMLDIGLIGYYLICFEFLKRATTRFRKYLSWEFFAFLLMAYFAWQNIRYWDVSLTRYAEKRLPIQTPRGTLFSWEDLKTQRFIEAIQYLREATPKDATVVVVPEGVGLNFFAERENPSGYHSFMPTLCELIGEQTFITRLTEVHADYVVILHRLAFEYGLPAFGIHYGRDMYRWITEHYHVVKVIGPYPFTSDDFGIAILQKNP